MSLTLSRPFTISTYDPPSTLDYIGSSNIFGKSAGPGQTVGGSGGPAAAGGVTPGTPPRQDSKGSEDKDKTPS